MFKTSLRSISEVFDLSIANIICPQVDAEGRTAHNNGWNGANVMASNTWKPWKKCVWCIWYHSAPVINTSLFSPMKVPPTSCASDLNQNKTEQQPWPHWWTGCPRYIFLFSTATYLPHVIALFCSPCRVFVTRPPTRWLHSSWSRACCAGTASDWLAQLLPHGRTDEWQVTSPNRGPGAPILSVEWQPPVV